MVTTMAAAAAATTAAAAAAAVIAVLGLLNRGISRIFSLGREGDKLGPGHIAFSVKQIAIVCFIFYL